MAVAEGLIPGQPFFLQEDPASTQPIYYSAKDFRNYTTSFYPRSGVLGTAAFRVTQAANVSLKVRINWGYANVGGYIVYLPADIEIPLDGAGWKPTNGTSTHKVFIAIYDEYISGSINKAQVVVTQDIGAGAPIPPGAAAYLQLGTVKITSTQANVQDKDITNVALHGGTGGSPGTGTYLSFTPYLLAAYDGSALNENTAPFRGLYDSGIMRLSGMVKQVSGNAFPAATNITLGTLISNLRPRYETYLTGVAAISTTGTTGGTFTWRLIISKDGTMTARIPSTQAPLFLMFDGMTYDLD